MAWSAEDMWISCGEHCYHIKDFEAVHSKYPFIIKNSVNFMKWNPHSFESSTLSSKYGTNIVDFYPQNMLVKPEKMYKGSFNVRIPSELHRQATLYSAAKNMSLNEFVRFAIDFTLSRASGPGGAVQP